MFENKMYTLCSPKDGDLTATVEYRRVIERKFDLVFVQQGQPLEPNFILILGVPRDADPREFARINFHQRYFAKNGGQMRTVSCRKIIEDEDSKFCPLIIDCGYRLQEARQFANFLLNQGVLFEESRNGFENVWSLQKKINTYY